MRSRATYRLSSQFSIASPHTKKVTPSVLDELGKNDSMSSMIVDSFEASGGSSQDAAVAVVDIFKSRQGR